MMTSSTSREQNAFKNQLLMKDTPDISDLTSGLRRKANGSRYYVGGVDISFVKSSKEDACACLCVLQMPDLEMVYEKMEMVKMTQPYIPGFLAFREVPALLKLYRDLEANAPEYKPDVILVDGNGTLHPKGFGLACQLGVILGLPTIGIAKTLISAQGVVDDQQHKIKKQNLYQAGDSFDLVSDTGEVLGQCVRVHDKAPNPVYISVGHMISLKSSVWIALECSKYRTPEPIRRADLDSREYLRCEKKEPYEMIA
ncbi:endonuclease V-like isoform X2 [Physella acuta]|uniref:endonuclease V-like isoform X2 n=1 Tax=Physella acuta TaxID=109671 RepID=UPI0027DD927B|nr:endonuclease V-like isoform X2 [Physella acuta]